LRSPYPINDFRVIDCVAIGFGMKVGFPRTTGSIGLLAATRPSLRFDPNGVVHGFVQPLFSPQVAFGGLNAHMTQQELNLPKVSARHVAEPRTRAPQVVRR
jgi:hypothetical protein